MHVLVIGGGGREHAITWKLAQSARVDHISVAPGNAGIDEIENAHAIDVDATDVVSLLDFAETNRVDLIIVGPEEPLAGGLVDQFEAAGLRIFGPSRKAALIETSKSYAKHLMTRQNVPTAPYHLFTELDPALDYLMNHRATELVIKADGLAQGKGVFLPQGESDAEGILRALLERDALGRAGRQVIVEQKLIGAEISMLAFTDGQSMAMMPPVCDHKPLYNQDRGPHTGGMGAYAPALLLTAALTQRIQAEIIEPTLAGLRADKHPLKGVLYVGVVLTQAGPVALELNVRFGDPNAQTVLPLLETDVLDVFEACIDGTLDQVALRWRDEVAVSVVLATAGYPERNDPDIPIHQTDPLPEGVLMFHAGTRAENGTLFTTGGRVLNLTGIGPDLATATRRTYAAQQCMHFDGVHYRTDIGSTQQVVSQ